MKRLFLLMVFLAVSVQVDAAKMSSYTNNTTPNGDVYFVGVDPNDLSQTVNGSNYRYSINSIMGLGLIDAVFASLSVSGAGDSWLELNNNASFSGSLVGKYGYSFLTANPTAIINGTTARLALYSELGSFAFDTYPTYEDSAHSSGIAVNGTTLAVYSETASKWLTVALTDSLNPTPTLPTFVSAEQTDGTTFVLTLSEAITIGAGGSGGVVVTGSITGASATTYASGDTTASLTYTTTETFVTGETITVAYTQPGNGLEDSGGDDLASFTSQAVTNSIVGATNRFEWDAEDLTAEVFDADDGGTITVASEGTPSHSFVTGQTNNAIQLASGTWCYAPASNTNNIVGSAGTISFDFRRVSGTSSNAHRIIAWGNTDIEFHLQRSSLNENRYSFSIAGVNYYHDTTENLYDGNWHHIILTWDCAAQTHSFQIDSSTYSMALTTTDTPTPGNNRLYFNGVAAASSALTVNIDNVVIE